MSNFAITLQGKGVMTTYWLDSELGRRSMKSMAPQVDQVIANVRAEIEADVPSLTQENINEINKIVSS